MYNYNIYIYTHYKTYLYIRFASMSMFPSVLYKSLTRAAASDELPERARDGFSILAQQMPLGKMISAFRGD